MIRVKKPQDIGAAVLIIIMGAVGLWVGRNYRFGTSARMGPGYFPVMLSWLLIGFGIIIGGLAFAFEGPKLMRPNWRGILLVLAGILLFGLLIERVGLAATALAVPLLAAFATPEVRWKEAVALAVGLAVACVVVFIYALRQPMQVFACPGFICG